MAATTGGAPINPWGIAIALGGVVLITVAAKQLGEGIGTIVDLPNLPDLPGPLPDLPDLPAIGFGKQQLRRTGPHPIGPAITSRQRVGAHPGAA